MPVVLRIRGYRFWFYEADLDEPPHVHVGKNGNEAKFWIQPLAMARAGRFRPPELREIERILVVYQSDTLAAWEREQNVIAVRAKIRLRDHDAAPIVPIVVPELDAVRQFAAQLHAAGQPWHGEAFGWDAEYSPERPTPPLDSKMTFTPADFCIGESGIWFFSLMWEHGHEQPPVEFLDERNLVGPAA